MKRLPLNLAMVLLLLFAAPSSATVWFGDQEALKDCDRWAWTDPWLDAPADTRYTLCFTLAGHTDPGNCYPDVQPGVTACLPPGIGETHNATLEAYSPSENLLRISPPTETYRAPDVDYDDSGQVDNFDLFQWADWFETLDPQAYVNDDGIVDLFDLFDLVDHHPKCVSTNGAVYELC